MTSKHGSSEEVIELLRTMLIVQLGLAGIGQRQIREVVGCDLNRVTRTLKALKPSRASRKRK